MNYYRICLLDQPKTSWILHELVKKLPRKREAGVSPVFDKFFPRPDAAVQMKPEYLHLRCKKCGRYESDPMFTVGFSEPIAIRFKQDLEHTDDRMFMVNDKCLRVLQQARVGGYETSPIGRSGWHAFRVTLLVDTIKGLVKTKGLNCPECGRPGETFGSMVWRLRELSPPDVPNTFFSTKAGNAGDCSYDRAVYLTEDVYRALKTGKIKGPHCERLQTEAEVAKRKKLDKQGIRWLPPGLTVYLSGK
jgi:hypothetical protein